LGREEARSYIGKRGSTKLHWEERKHEVTLGREEAQSWKLAVKDLSSGLTFFLIYEQQMATFSENTGSAPLIGSEVSRDSPPDVSIWSKNASSDPRSDAKSDTTCVPAEADRTPRSKKAP